MPMSAELRIVASGRASRKSAVVRIVEDGRLASMTCIGTPRSWARTRMTESKNPEVTSQGRPCMPSITASAYSGTKRCWRTPGWRRLCQPK